MKKYLLSLSHLLASFADPQARTCYICLVAITEPMAVMLDYHLCSECHALTRDLAKRRRKERGTRKKDRIKQAALALGLSIGETKRLIAAGHVTLTPRSRHR